MTSGLLLNDDIYWISFHGVYDFAYLLRVATNLNLPENDTLFFDILKVYFPHYYDIRYLVRYTENFRGSLSKLGQELNVPRVGTQHQAGSDSLITSEIFNKLRSEFISGDLLLADKNVLFGIGVGDESEHNNPTFYGGGNQSNGGSFKNTTSYAYGDYNGLYGGQGYINHPYSNMIRGIGFMNNMGSSLGAMGGMYPQMPGYSATMMEPKKKRNED
jgi:hypothetical protein